MNTKKRISLVFDSEEYKIVEQKAKEQKRTTSNYIRYQALKDETTKTN